MHVRVVETVHHKMAAQVDDLRIRAFGLQDFVARSNRENTIAADCDCLGPLSRDQGRRVNTTGIDVAVREDDVGLGLVRRVLCRHAHDQAQSEDQCSSHYSPIPASASIVSSMRFSPMSLPLQSNHSCNVCAPPPEPPPPMAMASLPSDSGM